MLPVCLATLIAREFVLLVRVEPSTIQGRALVIHALPFPTATYARRLRLVRRVLQGTTWDQERPLASSVLGRHTMIQAPRLVRIALPTVRLALRGQHVLRAARDTAEPTLD